MKCEVVCFQFLTEFNYPNPISERILSAPPMKEFKKIFLVSKQFCNNMNKCKNRQCDTGYVGMGCQNLTRFTNTCTYTISDLSCSLYTVLLIQMSKRKPSTNAQRRKFLRSSNF